MKFQNVTGAFSKLSTWWKQQWQRQTQTSCGRTGKTLTFEAKYLGRGWGSDLRVLQLQTSLPSRSGRSKWNPALRTHEPRTLQCPLCLPRWGRGVSRSCFKEMTYICFLWGAASQSESASIQSESLKLRHSNHKFSFVGSLLWGFYHPR